MQFVSELNFDTQCILLDLRNLACTSARTKNKTCLKASYQMPYLQMLAILSETVKEKIRPKKD